MCTIIEIAKKFKSQPKIWRKHLQHMKETINISKA